MSSPLSTWLLLVALASAPVCRGGERALESTVGETLPPHVGSCVMAVDRGQIVFEHADGYADVESRTPCTSETNFRLASVSKQFTATAVLLLVDRGQLSLDDNIAKFFPDFPKFGEKITVKHLLTHTSGLPAYEDLVPPGTTLQLDDYDVLHLLMDTKEPKFPPGERFEYSNSGYTLLGLIIEGVARQPFHEFLAREVFQPLGMGQSVMYVRGLNSVANRAYGHVMKNREWVRSDQSLTSAVRGDGGVYSSLRDYRQWLTAMDERKLLSKTSYDAMFSPQVRTDRGDSWYGYGWFIDKYRGELRIHHNGETHGFRQCVQRYPKRQAAVVIQLNSDIEGLKLTELGERVSDLLIFDRGK